MRSRSWFRRRGEAEPVLQVGRRVRRVRSGPGERGRMRPGEEVLPGSRVAEHGNHLVVPDRSPLSPGETVPIHRTEKDKDGRSGDRCEPAA